MTGALATLGVVLVVAALLVGWLGWLLAGTVGTLGAFYMLRVRGRFAGPKVNLAAIESAAVVCAVDIDESRLLGPVGCWSVDLATGTLTSKAAAPLPGHALPVNLDDRCARGYCLPKDALLPADAVAHMVWNPELTKVAVLTGDKIHVFDAPSKAHESTFSIRGDKGAVGEPTALHWNASTLFVEASDGTSSGVWAFGVDGAAQGALEPLGGKDKAPLSTHNGSFVVLGDSRVGISEQGMSALTTYETDSGKRARLVRKVAGAGCKKAELDGYWKDPSTAISTKCKDFIAKNYAHLVGADVVAGKNLLVLLRGPRLGELAVLDAKSLAELRAIKMPWCDAGGADKASAAEAAPAKAPRARAAKAAPSAKEDPDAGGQ